MRFGGFFVAIFVKDSKTLLALFLSTHILWVLLLHYVRARLGTVTDFWRLVNLNNYLQKSGFPSTKITDINENKVQVQEVASLH